MQARQALKICKVFLTKYVNVQKEPKEIKSMPKSVVIKKSQFTTCARIKGDVVAEESGPVSQRSVPLFSTLELSDAIVENQNAPT